MSILTYMPINPRQLARLSMRGEIQATKRHFANAALLQGVSEPDDRIWNILSPE